MDKLNELVEKILMPFATWVNNNKSLQAISKGFMAILPVTIISSLFYLIANFPITAWTDYLASSGLSSYVLIPYNVTMSLFAIYAAFSIGYAYASHENQDGLSAGVLSLINFLIVTPYTLDAEGLLFGAGDLAYNFG
jgi:PTS system cellobiose-specific IIC component